MRHPFQKSTPAGMVRRGSDPGRKGGARKSGRALLGHDIDSTKAFPQLKPRCPEATDDDPLSSVVKDFFGKEGDQAYFDLKRRGSTCGSGPRCHAHSDSTCEASGLTLRW